MKKLFLLFILFFPLLTQAQITNKILGLTLGVSTKEQVKSFIRNNHFEVIDNEEDIIRCNNLSLDFGGQTWNGLDFAFSGQKLYFIDFVYMSRSSVQLDYDRLKYLLDDKYGHFPRENDNTNGYYLASSTYSDGKTLVSVAIGTKGDYYFLHLSYCDIKLINKIYDKS